MFFIKKNLLTNAKAFERDEFNRNVLHGIKNVGRSLIHIQFTNAMNTDNKSYSPDTEEYSDKEKILEALFIFLHVLGESFN